MIRTHLLSLLSLLSLLALLSGAPQTARAAESYDNCTGFITSVPTTISTQGTWCLKQDLATAITTGQAISINTNNVTIDCNDFRLSGNAAGAGTTTYGIYANNRINATVRHCDIRGFYEGIVFIGSGSAGHAVEDNRFDGNLVVGIEADGDGSTIRGNQVLNTGGSTTFASAYGIYSAYSANIVDNSVSGVTARTGGNGYAVGIYTFANLSGRITNNGVRGLAADGTGTSTGIENVNSDRLVLRDNDLVGDASAGSLGLYCETSKGSAKDNVIDGFATANTFCTSDGGNDVTP